MSMPATTRATSEQAAPVRIAGLATATPPNRLPQRELRSVAASLLGDDHPTLAVFDNARIESRSLAMPIEWYLEKHGHADRNAAYAQVGLELALQASLDALERSGTEAAQLGAIVLASTTGLATPSLDARLAVKLGCDPATRRLPVWGLGCAGGVGGLNRAAEWCRHLGKPVLLVAVELCSLSFDIEAALGKGPEDHPSSEASGPGDASPGATKATGQLAASAGQIVRPTVASTAKKAVIAASLFGDGAAAVVLAPEAGGWQHVEGAGHLFPGTERVMGWDVTDHNLDVVLSPEIPDIVRREARPLLEGFLAMVATRKANAPLAATATSVTGSTALTLVHSTPSLQVDEWILHPGGAKVIDAYRDSLGLDDQELRHTDRVLREHGNMSSPTVLFALGTMMQESEQARGYTPHAPRNALLAAWGPGFASEMALVSREV